MRQLTIEQTSFQTPIVNGIPCLTTKAGIQVGRHYIAPPRNDMSPEERYWQSMLLGRPLESITDRIVLTAITLAKLFCFSLAIYIALYLAIKP